MQEIVIEHDHGYPQQPTMPGTGQTAPTATASVTPTDTATQKRKYMHTSNGQDYKFTWFILSMDI